MSFGEVLNVDINLEKDPYFEFEEIFSSAVDLIDTRLPVEELSLEALRSELRRVRAENDYLKELVYVDALTGCQNARFFDYKKKHINPYHDFGKVAIIFFDIDNLKVTNDEFGYAAGDNLIIAAANSLKDGFRDDDDTVRIGGDELIEICRNTNNDENFEDNLRKKAEEIVRNSLVPMSFGIAIYDERDYAPKIKKDKKGLENTKNRAGYEMQRNKRIRKVINALRAIISLKELES